MSRNLYIDLRLLDRLAQERVQHKHIPEQRFHRVMIPLAFVSGK